uniref:hypothetical protein n=1 Tax=Candidatus Thiosymbion oneisti TaxID=589554 RepID=UPI003C7D5671
ALSSNDMWAAVLQEKDGKAVLTTADESCFIGSTTTEKPLNMAAFTGANNDTGLQDAERLKEGYIEFVVMGYAEPTTGIGKAIEDVKSTRNCSAVRDAFSEAKIKDTAKQFGEPINALKFNFRFINPKRGIEAGGQAVTWANFFNHVSDP